MDADNPRPITYSERRAAGEFERMAEERAAERAQLPTAVVEEPVTRTHVPLGSDIELETFVESEVAEGGGGGGSLTDLTDVSGEPGPGVSPVGDDTGMFPLVAITTEADLDAVLATVARVEWHNIGAPGEPPFAAGWRNIGEPWAPMRFRILANSTVRLQGTIRCDDASIADATWIPICQLPPAAAPGENLEFTALTNADTTPGDSRMYVWADGTIVWGGWVTKPTAPVERLALNFLSWSTDGPTSLLAETLAQVRAR